VRARLGAWPVPGSHAAYIRRLGAACTDWRVDVEHADDVFTRRQRKDLAKLDRLTPASGFEEQHDALVSSLVVVERRQEERSGSLGARSREALQAGAAASAAAAAIRARATADGAKRYSRVVEAVLDERQRRYAEATRRDEAASAGMLRRLRRMVPPASVAAQHADLVDAMHGYVAAMAAFHAACDVYDLDRAESAGDALEAAHEEVHEALQALLEPPALPT
jgi:hypothetical protein